MEEIKTKIQNLDWTKDLIIKRFKKNPNSSVSALFRKLRNHPNLSLFADAPIIAHIVNTLISVGINPKRNQISYTLRHYSPELKGRRSFINSLFALICCTEQNKIESGRSDAVRGD